jgi:protein phosphatase
MENDIVDSDAFHAHGRIDCHGLSDPGAANEFNADQFLIADFRKLLFVNRSSPIQEERTRFYGSTYGQLLLVADGAGSGTAGRFASAIAVDRVTDHLLRRLDISHHAESCHRVRMLDEFRAAFQECRDLLKAAADADPKFQCMSTTLTMAYITWPQVYLVHAGDSRCYLHRNSRLRRLTTDHTVADKMVEAGVLGPDRMQHSPWRNVLWKAIGVDGAETEPDIHQFHLMVDDTLLLCTAGLTKYVDDKWIATVLEETDSPEDICHRLVQAAKGSGGADNITVIAARLRNGGRQEDAASDGTALPQNVQDALESR